MKASKFRIVGGVDSVNASTCERWVSLDCEKEFRTFAAAWRYVHSRKFTKMLGDFIDTARNDSSLLRAEIEGGVVITVGDSFCICASMSFDNNCDSAWSRRWEL